MRMYSDDVYELVSKLDKFRTIDEILRTIFMWVKCDYISYRQFKELLQYYSNMIKEKE
jgi:hypothetical protein